VLSQIELRGMLESGDLVQCHACLGNGKTTYHFDCDNKCPECGAGLYWQCAPEYIPTTKDIQMAYNQEAIRLSLRVSEIADSETMKSIGVQLILQA